MTEQQMIDCLLYELAKKDKLNIRRNNIITFFIDCADCYIYFKRRTARPLQATNYRITDTVKQDTKAA